MGRHGQDQQQAGAHGEAVRHADDDSLQTQGQERQRQAGPVACIAPEVTEDHRRAQAQRRADVGDRITLHQADPHARQARRVVERRGCHPDDESGTDQGRGRALATTHHGEDHDGGKGHVNCEAPQPDSEGRKGDERHRHHAEGDKKQADGAGIAAGAQGRSCMNGGRHPEVSVPGAP